MANKIDKALKEINAMFDKHNAEIQAAEKDLEAIKADIVTQKTAKDQAAGTDPDAFVMAEKKLEADELDEKMTAARIQKLKETPLFSESQFKEIRSVLYAELDDLTAATEKKLEAATLQMYADGQALGDQRETTRGILQRVFVEMNKDGKRRNWNADTYSAAINALAWSKKAYDFYKWHKKNGQLHIN